MWPRITVVTPSFNQSSFIEETIRSVLLQGYPDLQYVVMDGGSTDGSVEIIRKYSRWIDYWTSGPDGGQSAAINRGLEIGTGDFAAWINSDDMLFPNALFHHATRIGFNEGTVYIGQCAYLDVHGRITRMHRSRIRTLEELLRVPEVWRQGGNIVQPEVLFPRQLALRVGGLDVNNHYSMDYDLWGRFLIAGACFQCTDVPFGMLRSHRDQKTTDGLRTTESLVRTALKLLEQADGLSGSTRETIEMELRAYLAEYPEKHWKKSGRLARIGLPRSLVIRIRSALKILRLR
ncbi:MAG TPA: glycosyltransferase family 2 protein [candidate division Zixibacteria bacterium]|nr:glycosyltransferase family 2 protein [candidate division Zixibacteria bacterium]